METYSASGVVSFNKMDFASEPVIFPRGREEKRKKKKRKLRMVGSSDRVATLRSVGTTPIPSVYIETSSRCLISRTGGYAVYL